MQAKTQQTTSIGPRRSDQAIVRSELSVLYMPPIHYADYRCHAPTTDGIDLNQKQRVAQEFVWVARQTSPNAIHALERVFAFSHPYWRCYR